MKTRFIKNSKKTIWPERIMTYWKTEPLSTLFLAVAVVAALCIVVKVAGFFVTSVSAQILVKKAIAQSDLDPNEMDKYFVKSRDLAEELKKKNLFAPLPPKQHPVKEVSGILGDEVLIGGKWYKAGDMVSDANILAVEPMQVKIEWDGKEKYFAPIASADKAGPKQVSIPVKQVKKAEKKLEKKQEQSTAVETEARPPRERRRGRRPRNRSPEERAERRARRDERRR